MSYSGLGLFRLERGILRIAERQYCIEDNGEKNETHSESIALLEVSGYVNAQDYVGDNIDEWNDTQECPPAWFSNNVTQKDDAVYGNDATPTGFVSFGKDERHARYLEDDGCGDDEEQEDFHCLDLQSEEWQERIYPKGITGSSPANLGMMWFSHRLVTKGGGCSRPPSLFWG